MERMRLTKTGKIVIISSVLLIVLVATLSLVVDDMRYKALIQRYNTPVPPVFVIEEIEAAPEHGSHDMEPYIYKAAKANLDAFDSEDREDMLWYIVQHENNFFESDSVMENLMFIGLILEKTSPNENASKLGGQVYTVCKNMYNGWETEDSHYIVSKLERISKYIDIFINEWYS